MLQGSQWFTYLCFILSPTVVDPLLSYPSMTHLKVKLSHFFKTSTYYHYQYVVTLIWITVTLHVDFYQFYLLT